MPLISALNDDGRQNAGWPVATVWLPEKNGVSLTSTMGKVISFKRTNAKMQAQSQH
jgi:hypothetical protein